MKLNFYLVLLLTVSFSGCSTNNKNSENKTQELEVEKARNKVYTNTKYNYTFEYPNSWNEMATNTFEEVYIFGPEIDSGLFKRDGTIAIAAQLRDKDFTLEESYAGNMRHIYKTSKNFKLIGEKEVTINEIKMKAAMYQVDESVTMTAIQYYFKKDKISFVMGGAIPAYEMGKYEKIYTDIIKTFKFIKE